MGFAQSLSACPPGSEVLNRTEQMGGSWSVQVRMGNGEEFLEESPYKSLEDLWDGEFPPNW